MRNITCLLLFFAINLDLFAGATVVITPALTPNCKNGSIDLTVTGGFGSYCYEWEGPGGFSSTDKNIYSLAPGEYRLTVTDALCGVLKQTYVVPYQFESIGYLKDFGHPHTSTSCEGFVDVGIQHVPSATYKWSNGATTQDIYVLCAGTYTVTITYDFQNCREVLSVVLSPCPSPAKSIDLSADIKHAVAANNNVGSIDLKVNNGAPSWPPRTYAYSWTGPNGFTAFNQDISGLSAGTYQVVVNDGCNKTTTSYSVYDCNSNYTVRATATSEPDNTFKNPPKLGSVEVFASGGIAPYKYSWSHTVSLTNSDVTKVSNLSAGDYTVTVTDYCGNTAVVVERVARCQDLHIWVDDNCSDDPELKVAGNRRDPFNNLLNTKRDNYSPSPTYCDKSLFVTWPDGSTGWVVLDESKLVNIGENPENGKVVYKYNTFDIDLDVFNGQVCAKLVDNCGCEYQECVLVGEEIFYPTKCTAPGNALIPYYPPGYEVLVGCKTAKTCTSAAYLPNFNDTEGQCNIRQYFKYTNNDPVNPCKGGSILCSAPNEDITLFAPLSDVSGDIVFTNPDEPPTYSSDGFCVYKIGCLFTEGMIPGITDPVFVYQPKGYKVPYVDGLCEKKSPYANFVCNGTIIKDPQGVDDDCFINLKCIGQDGFTTVGRQFMGRYCKCSDSDNGNTDLILACDLKPGDGRCKSRRTVIDNIKIISGGIIIGYTPEYLDFLDDYIDQANLPLDFDFPQCEGVFTGEDPIDRSSPDVKNTLYNRSVKVFPNPFSETVSIFFRQKTGINAAYIQNAAGYAITVQMDKIVSDKDGLTLTFTNTQLPQGVYFLRVLFSDGSRETVKLLKVRR